MALSTLDEIRDNVATSTRETQINSLIDTYINLTLQEINDPAWAFEQVQAFRGYNHLWSFNRRATTLSVSAQTAQLPRDLDKLALIRQTTTPAKLLYVPDEVFYHFIPDPTATGTPLYYRIWEEEGVSTRLSVDDTVKVVSSSASDTSSFTVSVVGYSTTGYIQSEVITLNGITAVNGTLTFDNGRPLRISKSGKTTGTITVTEFTAGTTLLVMSPEDRSPRFKVLGLYPIPTSAITLSLEYFTRIRQLVNDADVPDIDEKWLWVVRLGAVAKVYQYQNKDSMFASAQAMYAAGVRSMVKSDMQDSDYIPALRSHKINRAGKVYLSDSVTSGFYGQGYGLNY